jgi:hypothetical protein
MGNSLLRFDISAQLAIPEVCGQSVVRVGAGAERFESRQAIGPVRIAKVEAIQPSCGTASEMFHKITVLIPPKKR